MKKMIEKYNNLPIQIKASLWFLICSFLQKGISIITTPIFTRLLSTEEYGTYSIFSSWENIIIVFVSLHIAAGVYNQGLIKYEKDQESYSSSLLGLSIVLFGFWIIVYILFKDYINELLSLKTSYMVLMFIYMFTFTIFAFWSSKERVNYNYKRLVLITLVSSILNPLLGIIFIDFFEDSVFARILGTCVAWGISYLWMIIEIIKKGKRMYSKKYWIGALKFNIPLVPHYLSQTLLNSSDRIMIGRMVDDGAAGIYGLAYSISLIMTLFNTALSQTITPWMYRKIKENNIKKISSISYSTMVMIAILNIMLIAFAPEAVKIFAPSEYYEAIYVIPPVAMSVYFMYLYDLFAKFEFYYEKTKLIATSTVLGAVLNLALNYLFIGKYGYIAAGYTTLICYILYALFHYIAMRKVCKEKCNNEQPFDLKIILIISTIFLIVGFIFLLLYKYLYMRFVVIIITLISCIVFRKRIMENVKRILLLRQEK